jgi:hypothetical protein
MNELWLVVNPMNSCSFMPDEFPAMQGAHVIHFRRSYAMMVGKRSGIAKPLHCHQITAADQI